MNNPEIKTQTKFSSYQILVICLLALTQFTVVLDFMVMSPLGDMLMKSMELKTKEFGLVVSAYALSAGVSGILTAGFALFPFLLPSSIDPTSSLTMWDAVSSHKTLGVMTVAACIFVPLILIYTSWSYYKMWGVITNKHIEENSHSLY